MKTLFTLLAVASLASCTTRTETLPDGTVVKTDSIDSNAIFAGAAVAKVIIDRTSGK